MKIKHTICILLILTLTNMSLRAQLVTENFNAGLPATWTQSPAATWSLNANLNPPGNCIISENIGSASVTASIFTPTLNVTGMINFTFTFKAAVTKNNFMAPQIILSYSSAAGTQTLATWGYGLSGIPTYSIEEGFETQSSIGPEDVFWQNCTHTVSAVTGNTGRFVFTSNNINGGWALLDDVVISATSTNTTTTAMVENTLAPDVSIFPNPGTGKRIKLAGKNIQEVFIIDNLGRRLFFTPLKTDDGFEINLDAYPEGIYYLTAVMENQVQVQKKIVLD